MFDTIRMKANVSIDSAVFPQDRTKIVEKLNRETGEVRSTYQVKDERIHYIFYSANSELLIIEVSIPKFLFGHNVRMVNESDIEAFWTELDNKLYDLLQVEIDHSLWTVERLDVCKNFDVGSQVDTYIAQIAKKHVPYYKRHLIGNNETVEFKTKRNQRAMTFYDKRLECIAHKEPREVIEQARGILRFEISPSKHDLGKYSADKKAVDFLTKRFFEYIMSKPKVQSLLKFPEAREVPTISSEWFKSQELSITRVETAIGFKTLLDALGESELRPMYNSPQTFTSRKQLVQTLESYSAKGLADLTLSVSTE